MMPKSMDQHISPQGGPGGWGAGGGMVMKLAAKCIDDCVAWEIGGRGKAYYNCVAKYDAQGNL